MSWAASEAPSSVVGSELVDELVDVASGARAAAAAPLSALNEELSDTAVVRRCSRWPARLALLASDGTFVRGRCGSANLCEYCLIQYLHLVRRMLSRQALAGPAPEIVAVLGTGEATWDPAPFYEAREMVLRALRREFGPSVGYAALSEFTTGKSAYSGGLRRPHWNMPIIGVPADRVDRARDVVITSWCANAPNTDPAAQYVEPLKDTAALMRYVANHFTKTEQMPPMDGRWKHKQRFNCSRNYFAPLTRAQARDEAQASLQRDRAVFKAVAEGASDPMAAAGRALELAGELTWVLRAKGAVVMPSEAEVLAGRAAVHYDRWVAMGAC